MPQGFVCRPSCAQVRISQNSSSVPNPPGSDVQSAAAPGTLLLGQPGIVQGHLEVAGFLGGTGAIRTVYLAMLVSHILLALAIVPLILTTLVWALRARIPRRKTA